MKAVIFDHLFITNPPELNTADKVVKAVIFDLDGTLLDTLGDLRNSVNYALREMGWKERTLEEVRHFVGNGVHKLVERSVPEGTKEDELERCFAHFQKHYLIHCQDTTDLYPGVGEMLQKVHAKGLLTAIVSNKLQAGVDELYEKFFRDVVDVAIGQRKGVPLKPQPDMVNLALEALGVSNDEAIYVGDSEVDVATASNANLPCTAVLWGFRTKEELLNAGANQFISEPLSLLHSL